MKISAECMPCLVWQAAEAIAMVGGTADERDQWLRRVLRELAAISWEDSPPLLAARLHRALRDEMGVRDPYRAVKERMNRLAADLLPLCRECVAQSSNPREAIVRLVVTGNLLDCGAKGGKAAHDLPDLLASIWQAPFAGDVEELFRAAERAGKILYLADNAGEIVLDRLLLEALPAGKTTVAVRGRPVLNDALLEDARFAGLQELARLITNGSDVPGTHLASCSSSFRRHFWEASLVISKGQGNYETLQGVAAPVFFLFTVKCPLIAGQTGHPVSTLVAERSATYRERDS